MGSEMCIRDRYHYKRFVETCDELAERYETGVPDDAIALVAKELSKHV